MIPINPRLGYCRPMNAVGESAAKMAAAEQSVAKIVQNRFSYSCAWCTSWDSLARKT